MESGNKFETWLNVEIAATEAMNKLGLVPDADLKNIQQKVQFKVSEINDIENKVHHDVIAFLQMLQNMWDPQHAIFILV